MFEQMLSTGHKNATTPPVVFTGTEMQKLLASDRTSGRFFGEAVCQEHRWRWEGSVLPKRQGGCLGQGCGC